MMRVSIERLRMWLLVGAGLLVVVIAAFLGYAHMRAHRFLRDLPGRLGVNITRESNGFTYSQSGKGGRTIYTIHAAKLVQYKDGKTMLHDVGIVLYGQGQGQDRADRADRIYGSEFEYDQRAGVVRAVGEVHLDLQAPDLNTPNLQGPNNKAPDHKAGAPVDARGRPERGVGGGAATGAGGGVEQANKDERVVHVKTSGLVFVQSLGVASTDQEIEFEYNGLNGRAKGADYNADTGVTVLQSEVRVSGLREGQPVILTAAHAEMDRGKQELRLERARSVAVGEGDRAKGSGRTATAERAVVHLRGDGSVERVEGSGGVSLEQAGGVLHGQSAEVGVSADSRPETARITGGLTYTEDSELRQVQGRAGQGTARFDAAGRVASAVLMEAAKVQVRERSTGAAVWSERTATGDRMEMKFATAETGGASAGGGGARGGRQFMREVVATGRARVLVVDRGAAVEKTTELRGDTLSGEMVWDGRSGQLSHVSGTGHTAMRRSDTAGAVDTSEGESLEVSLGPAAAGAGGRGREAKGTAAGSTTIEGSTTILSAVQSGGVTLTHLAARAAGGVDGGRSSAAKGADGAKAGDTGLVRGTAGTARFEGATQTLTLTGQAQVAEGDSLVRADTVTMRQDSGDATAEGSVKVSYRQAGSTEPVHVLAARADLKHEAGGRDAARATFYGNKGVSGGAPARLWQGASQVEAAEIEFNQTAGTLVARTSGSGDLVRTVLVGGRAAAGAAGTSPGSAPRGAASLGSASLGSASRVRGTSQVMRVSSRSLRYVEAERRAQFGGGVVLEDADGTVRAAEVVALLRPAAPAAEVHGAEGRGADGHAADGRQAEGRGVGATAGFMGGGVERVVAEGGVEVSERGRRATGDRLVYTASDGLFVMTGTPAMPPKVVDEAQGTITGAALEFHAGDNSVMVLSSVKDGEGQRVHTETKVRQR